MSALNMGYAQLPIIPVLTGFNKTIKQEINSVFPSLGKQAGVDFGKSVAQGFSGEKKSLESEVKALEKNLASAQDNLRKAKEQNARASETELKAVKQVEIAEQRLAEQRESGKARASQLLSAEENLRQKQLALKKAQDDSHRSSVTLESATEDLTTANDKLKVAADKANKELSESTTSTDKAKKGLGGLTDEAEKTRGGLGKLGGYMKGAFVGAIAAVSFGAVIGEMKEMISLAGEYQQSVGAIDSIFKDQSGKMHAKAGEAAVDVGLDKNAYNELGSVLGAQLKNAGTPMDQLADKTSNLITLGADLSSMFGGTTKEAIEAVSSALKGEMDPIEKYGITLSAASLEAEALAKGLIKPVVDADLVSDAATKMQVAQKKYNDVVKKHGKDSMEAAKAQVSLNSAERAYDKATAGKVPKLEGEAKALAVQSALYSQSADAQGNFAKESDTLEGQQQRLNAEVANMKIAAGTAFLPAMTSMVSAIRTTVIPALQNMGAWIKDNQAWLKPLALTVGTMVGAFLAFKGVALAIAGVTRAMTLFRTAFVALTVAMNANIFVLIASAIAGLVVGFIYLWKTNEDFRNFFINSWKNISGFFVGIWENNLKPAFQAIGDFWVSTVVPTFHKALESVKGFFVSAGQGIQGALQAIGNFITNTLVPVFVWLYRNIIIPIFNGIKLVVAIAATVIISLFKAILWTWQNLLAPAILWVWNSVLKPVFLALGTFFSWVWNSVLKPVLTAVVSFFRDAFATAISTIWVTTLRPVFNAIGTVFKWVWETLLRPAFENFKHGFQIVATKLTEIWNTWINPVFQFLGRIVAQTVASVVTKFIEMKTKIEFYIKLVKAVITLIWNSIKTWLSDKAAQIRDTVVSAFNSLKSKVTTTFENLRDKIQSVWAWIKANTFDKMVHFVKETLPNAFKKGVDYIRSAWEKIKSAAAKPINFVIETVYTNGLQKTFNGIADNLKLPKGWRLPDAKPIAEFATGGYTGAGTKYQEAGVVHAGEFVIRKEATSKLRRTIGLRGLDYLNQFGTFPGFAKGGFVRPVKGGRYTSPFGVSRGRYPHAGQDIAVPIGTSVFSPLDGTVRVAKTNAVTGRSGLGILIDHANGLSTYQGHLSRLLARAGDVVKGGQQIALSGNTGNSTGPHLHTEIWRDGQPINPLAYLNNGSIPQGGSGGGGFNLLQPLFDLKDKMVNSFKDKFSGGFFNELAGSALGKMLNGPIDWIKEKAAAIGDVAQDVWGNTKDFFNGKDSPVQAAVRSVANEFGWGSGRHWDSLSNIISRESGWNPAAANPRSSARGLFQKMTSIHGAIESTPEGQARWGLNYIKGRYGNPESAWNFWKKHKHYAKGGMVEDGKLYDNGGYLAPGAYQTISNLSGKPEPVFTHGQWQILSKIVDDRVNGTAQTVYNIEVPEPAFSANELVTTISHHNRALRRGGK